MRERTKKQELPAVIQIPKILAGMYLVTGLMLLVLALLVSVVAEEELTAKIGVLVIYVLSCGMGGFLSGRAYRQKKFLWGLLMGGIYFALLFLISFVVNMGEQPNWVHMLTVMSICMGAGMAGGIIS